MTVQRQATSRSGAGTRGYRRILVYAVAVATLVVVLAALAFFLSPTGHVDLRVLVQVNGTTGSLPAGVGPLEFADSLPLSAHSGPSLDVNGDVLALGAGSAPTRLLNGGPLEAGGHLTDGAQMEIRHGEPVLEGLAKSIEVVPFATTVVGYGAIVSLAQMGSPGARDVYTGVVSGRQAAWRVTSAAHDTVYRLSDTATPGQKLAALTFDDGPGTHTLEVLDALASRHVPATFFVLGSSAAALPDVIEKMKAAGHEIENHTWSHPWLTKVSADQFASQIARTNNVIGGSRFLRPPYGDTNGSVRAMAASMGLRLAFWTVDTRDWERQDVDAIMAHVKAETRPGAIILMHDGGKDRLQTVAAIPVVIDWLFAQGYSLTTVDHIL